MLSYLLLYKMLHDLNDGLRLLPLSKNVSRILLSLLLLKTAHKPEQNIPPSEPNMAQQPSVVPTLLSLPGELKSNILDHCLSIKTNRVEHARYWCDLSPEQFSHMIGKIYPTAGNCTSDRDHSQKGYMTKVDCNLSVSLMHANRELYQEGRHIMREENKFIQIKGWTDNDFKALFQLGSIPIWSHQPISHMGTLVTQCLPCNVEPVLQFINHSRKGLTIFIYIKDLPLACKALYHCRTSPHHEFHDTLAMHFKVPATGLSPAFWDFKTDTEVKDFLNRGVIRFIGTCIQTIFFNANVWRPNEVRRPGSRPLNELEEWILDHVRPHFHDLQAPKLQYMRESALAKFAQAEKLVASKDGFSDAVGLYAEFKDLVHQMSREEYVFELNFDEEVIQDLFMKYSICCFRLSSMTSHLKDGLGATQWAYINCLEALSMVRHVTSEPKVRSMLLINLALLQLELQSFSDFAVASTLCLAMYEILQLGEPNMEYHELIAATSAHFKGADGPSPPPHWEDPFTEVYGLLFPMRHHIWEALYRTQQPVLTCEQWGRKFEQARALFDSHFPEGPEPADRIEI